MVKEMTKTMRLDIVSAEAEIFSGNVEFLTVTGAAGEVGVHPGHTALLTSLKPGQVKARLADGEEKVFYMSGGMLEVQPEVATVLADTAQRAEDLDEAAALAAKEKAEKAINKKKDGMEYSSALTELAEAAAQLRAIQMIRDQAKR